MPKKLKRALTLEANGYTYYLVQVCRKLFIGRYHNIYTLHPGQIIMGRPVEKNTAITVWREHILDPNAISAIYVTAQCWSQLRNNLIQ